MKKLLSCLCILFPLFSFAQNVLKVNIQNQSHQPISYASISIMDSSNKKIQSFFADSLGNFEWNSNTRTNAAFLEIQAVGYKNYHSQVPISDLLIIILEDSTNLSNVTVSTRKPLFEMKPDKMVMNVENNLMTVGSSIFDILRTAPMVKTDKDDNLLLKGLSTMIYIDDRPTYISGLQLVEYLKSLPAETIASIELITNPSSKYDAAGNGGIINIKLKKNKVYGMNGIATGTVGQGKYPKGSGSINLNYRNGKSNIYTYWYSGYTESFNELNYNSIISNNGVKTLQDRNNYWHPKSNYHYFKLGWDYTIGKKSVLGFLANGNLSNSKEITTNNSTFSDEFYNPERYIKTTLDGKGHKNNVTLNGNFKSDLDTLGSALMVDMDYYIYDGKNNSDNENNFLNRELLAYRNPYVFLNDQKANIHIFSAKGDYTKYLNKTLKMEAGAKYSSVRSDNDLVVDSLKGLDWDRNYGLTNHFIYTEKVSAFYSNLSKEWSKFSAQVGFRGELTNTNANSRTTNTITKRNYFNLFPSLFLTYKLNDKNDFNFNYSRRIQRPDYQDLNPFVRYIDPYTSFEGNAYLRPSFSNIFELKHGYRQFLFTTLSWTHSTGNISSIILQDSVTQKVINQPANLNSVNVLYLGVFTTIPFTKWWNAQFSADYSYNNGKSAIPGYSYNTKAQAASFSTDQTFTLPKEIKIQNSFYYNTPTKDGLARLRMNYSWRIGIQKTFWNKNATIKFTMYNILGTGAYRAHYLGDGLDIRWKNQWEARKGYLSFIYKFGNQKIKSQRDRNTASQSEQGRMN